MKEEAISNQSEDSITIDKKQNKDWPKLCNLCIRKTVPPSFYRLLQRDLHYSFFLTKKRINLALSNPKLITRLKDSYLQEIQQSISQSTPFRQLSLLHNSDVITVAGDKKETISTAREKKQLLKENINREIDIGFLQQQGFFLDENFLADVKLFTLNPRANVFIFGETGNGKSTLAKLLARKFSSWHYLTAEQFVEEFAHAARARDNFSWRKKIRAYPRILIDNFQYWKPTAKHSQEELIHLIDVFNNAGKSLIILSSIPLKELTISLPLKSRLQNFEELELRAPTLSLRKKIFRNQCNRSQISAKPEVMDYLCRKITTNMRLLKTAVNRLKKTEQKNALHFPGKKWNKSFSDLYSNANQDAGSLVLQVVAEFFHVATEDILSTSRQRQFTRARHLAAYICASLLKMKYQEIATLLNRKQHGTIISACRKIEKAIQEDLFMKEEIKNIQKMVKKKL